MERNFTLKNCLVIASLSIVAVLISTNTVKAQLSVTSAGTAYTIDFSTTVTGKNKIIERIIFFCLKKTNLH